MTTAFNHHHHIERNGKRGIAHCSKHGTPFGNGSTCRLARKIDARGGICVPIDACKAEKRGCEHAIKKDHETHIIIHQGRAHE